MKTAIKLFITVSALSILAACGNNTTNSATELSTSTPSNTSGSSLDVTAAQSVNAYRPPENGNPPESPMKARDLSAAPIATNIQIGAPRDNLIATARKNNETSAEGHMGKPLQIAFGREVTQTASTLATNQVLKWQATAAGGKVAAINFSSSGAKGIRIGLLISQLPASATLRFYVKGDATAFEIKGSEVLDMIAKNVASGDTSNDALTYWSPVLKKNNGTVEIEIPAGVDTREIQVSVPVISHLFMSMSDAQTIFEQATYSGGSNISTQTCQVDVKCTTPLPAASDAVAFLVYNQSGGFANICSGTLLNDSLNSSTPYILTANHCISTQTFASTLYTEFKYRSLSCNVATDGEYFPTIATGAALLYTAVNTDSTLLRLYGTPSTNVLFAGWDATTAPALNTLTHSIHHPQGDQQRLSRGSVTDYFSRSGVSSNIVSGTILGVTQSIGNTEPGSSGSSLLKGTDDNPIVIGQLFGRFVGNNAADSCLDAVEKRIYGRFDVAFKDGMNDWLSPTGRKVKYDFNASGKSDIIWTGLNSGSTFLQIGNPVTTPKLLMNSGITTVHSGDFNGDGHADIVYTSANGAQIEVVLLKNGYRMSSKFHSPSAAWPLAGAGDFDGDGKSDLIFRNPVTGQIIYWLMDGFNIKTNSGPKPVSQYWFIKGIGDVNGDGKDDVVWMNPFTGEQAIHIMNGTTYTLAGYQFVATAWEINGVGDLNGDGKADIIWRYPLTGQVFIYFMNGGTISSTASYGVAPSWKIRQIGDYDGDGKSDVLWQNESTGSLVIHHMNAGVIKSTATYQLDESLVKIQ